MCPDQAMISYEESTDALSTAVNVGGKSVTLLIERNALTQIADEAIGTVAGAVASLIQNTANVYSAAVKVHEETKTMICLMNQYGELIREVYGPPLASSTAAQWALDQARSSGFDAPIRKALEKKVMKRWREEMEKY